MTELAIVIPYYKPLFFLEALLSIRHQTDYRFHLYIGNDASPDDPTAIIEKVFKNSEAVTYKRFDSNFGQTHLAKQWERCIEMAEEPYIWLFSDDDIMPPDCVERFYRFIETEPDAELMRYNINIINDDESIIYSAPPHPLHETSQSFLERRLKGQCTSTACEYIFTKKVYSRTGGFIDFPVGWASDDATWMKFGDKTGINTIPGKPVLWRFGNSNISSSVKNRADKIKACLMFVNFVRTNYPVDKQLQLYWLFSQLAILKSSTTMKIRFFFNVVTDGMFSVIDVVGFFVYHAMKKITKISSK